jgi:Cu/Ag efflux protein CusF
MSPLRNLCAAAALFPLAAACEGPETEAPAPVAAAQEYMAVGTFNSVDAAARTVNVSHGPVPAAGWPAMTMDFKLAQREAARDLKAGDRVDIHFEIESGMNATITHIERIE